LLRPFHTWMRFETGRTQEKVLTGKTAAIALIVTQA
jgi:hypothetical protein